ncbi:MAG: ABC transporter substrate-binding protein [Parvibaculaceae bacterium]
MSRAVDRRVLLTGFCSAASLCLAGTAFAQTSRHPAVVYMQKVANDLFRAQKDGTIPAYLQVINRHADVPSIALYALGRYKADLPKSDYQRYYRGVAIFMSRYFADQTRHFRVAKAEFNEEPSSDGSDTLVRTKVTLMSGSAYNVVFRLSRNGSGYKVSDVTVLGFSLSYLQRGIFLSFLSKKNGDLGQLIAALNR